MRVQLANTSYTIPSGTKNLLIYVETDASTTDFYIDEAVGAVKGTVIEPKTDVTLLGDVNGDGKIDADDLKELQNYVLGKDSDIKADTSDMNDDSVIDSFDVALLRKVISKKSS